MNKYLIGGITGTALLLGSMGSAMAGCSGDGNNRWMTVYNKSRTTAWFIRVRPSSRNSWSRDLLGMSTIGGGRNKSIDFDYCNRSCILDIKVEGTRNREWRFNRVNVCRQSRLTLY